MNDMRRDIAYFLKVTKTEHINDLTKHGNLYLSLAEGFRDRKRYGGKKYDSEEGHLSTQYKFWVDMGNKNFSDPNTILDLSDSRVKGNECIYCLKAIYRDEIKSNLMVIPYDFFDNLIEQNDWSQYSVLIIKNVDGFLDCIEQAARLQDYTYCCKPVLYDDHFFECPYSVLSDEHAIEIYFHKREKFKEQSEYRILLQNRSHKDFILEIGTGFFTDANYIQLDDLGPLNTGRPAIFKV